MAKSLLLQRLTRRYSGMSRQRGGAIKKAAKAFEMVYFGGTSHEDDIDIIRGFTLSTAHIDQHFCVGQYDGYTLRMVDRFDIVQTGATKYHAQNWCIIEVSLERSGLPRTLLIPTGASTKEYSRFFTSHTKFQPLNTALFQHHSSELHGRFQIIASPSRTHDVEALLTTPIVMGISARFWPHGIEIYKNKLYVYITDRRLSSAAVLSAVESALWLADAIDRQEEI